MLRANRNDAKWMARYQERQARVARWKANFGSFIPLNITRFRAVVGMFMSVVASLCCGRTLRTRPAFANRSGMINFGGKKRKNKKRKTARAKSKSADSHSYNELEPRQLLAADILNVLDANDIPVAFVDNTGATADTATTNDTTPTISGKATADSKVFVSFDDGATVVAEVTADENGDWSFTTSTQIANNQTISVFEGASGTTSFAPEDCRRDLL